MRLGRRRLLKQILAGCAALGVDRWASATPAAPRTVLDELIESFGGLTAVRPLGAAYLAAFPARRDFAALAASLGLYSSHAHSAAQWLDELRWRQRDDFARGRMCRLRGWIVSETEARLCAVFVLRAAASGAG